MYTKMKKILLMLLAFLPILLIDYKMFSIDTYWEILYGKEILENGFFNKIILSVHDFHYIPQQWLTDVIIYLFYKIFGYAGCLIYVYLTSCIIILLFFAIINLVTMDYKKSSVLTFIFSLIFVYIYAESRPQMISFICVLSLIYILEKYVYFNHTNGLFFMPLIFILQINAHSSYYLFLIMIVFAYIFKFKFLSGKNIRIDEYKISKIIIFLIISCLCLFINPYGIDSILYIFRSLSDSIPMLSFEMQKLSIENYGIIFIICILLLMVILYNHKEKINLRYLLLLLGSTALMLFSVKSTIFFIIGYIIFVADYIKNIDTEKILNKIFGYYEIMIPIVFFVFIIYRIVNLDNFTLDNYSIRYNDCNTNGIIEAIKEDNDGKNVYSKFNIGGYLQFNGFNVYLNSGLEPFLYSNNKEKDIINEYQMLQFGRIDIKEFLDEYKFDYIIVDKDDILYDYCKQNNELLYTNGSLYVYK